MSPDTVVFQEGDLVEIWEGSYTDTRTLGLFRVLRTVTFGYIESLCESLGFTQRKYVQFDALVRALVERTVLRSVPTKGVHLGEYGDLDISGL